MIGVDHWAVHASRSRPSSVPQSRLAPYLLPCCGWAVSSHHVLRCQGRRSTVQQELQYSHVADRMYYYSQQCDAR